MHAHLFLDALTPALRAVDGMGVVTVAALSTLGSSDDTPWPPFRLGVVLSDPLEVEIAAKRLGFGCDVDRHGITVSAAGDLNGMRLVIFSNYRHDEGTLW